MMKFYMVTFDLKNSASRTHEYDMIRRELKELVGPQNYHRFTMQAAILRTSLDAGRLRDFMGQRLGGDCNILVVRLRKGYAFRLLKHDVRAEASRVLKMIPP